VDLAVTLRYLAALEDLMKVNPVAARAFQRELAHPLNQVAEVIQPLVVNKPSNLTHEERQWRRLAEARH